MLNLDALDTIIAIVVVILILSLLVQSIQSLVKKLLKLKSKEIEKSLLILFENVIEKQAQPKEPGAGSTAPGAGAATTTTTTPAGDQMTPAKLVGKVLDEFKAIGRTTKFQNPVLESISKEDLLKILARVESRT
ncbi:MAG TPA: hypothetical protein VJT74_09310, partial [Pyrinomonadaceae bacterium]|nr:hypothetical protein [Pyrinomonadaceae bacterium]